MNRAQELAILCQEVSAQQGFLERELMDFVRMLQRGITIDSEDSVRRLAAIGRHNGLLRGVVLKITVIAEGWKVERVH